MRGLPHTYFSQEVSLSELRYHQEKSLLKIRSSPMNEKFHKICSSCGTGFDSKCKECKDKYYKRMDERMNKCMDEKGGGLKVGHCELCGFLSTKICSSCKECYYCDKNCQVKHWAIHKKYCQEHSFKKNVENGINNEGL